MAHAHSIRENPGQIAGIAALSAAIGALAAMLFTPKNGEELRHGIGRRAHNAKDGMIDKFHSTKEDVADKAQGMKGKTKDKAAEMADKAKGKADR